MPSGFVFCFQCQAPAATLSSTSLVAMHLARPWTCSSALTWWAVWVSERCIKLMFVDSRIHGPQEVTVCDDGRIPMLRHIQKTWKAAGCWELLPAMTNPRHGCAACCTNGIVYVLGGADDAQSNALLFGFCEISDVWNTASLLCNVLLFLNQILTLLARIFDILDRTS